jgi:hypothetical protein
MRQQVRKNTLQQCCETRPRKLNPRCLSRVSFFLLPYILPAHNKQLGCALERAALKLK